MKHRKLGVKSVRWPDIYTSLTAFLIIFGVFTHELGVKDAIVISVLLFGSCKARRILTLIAKGLEN